MNARDSDRPIGVFDSGVGGLTVFKALKKRLSGESILYFGDTAHVPYGSKSREAVTRFSLTVGKFLAEHHIKLLVVACNTASALALPALKRNLGIPVVGVIEPGVRAAKAASQKRRIGVIATEATIGSAAYQTALRRCIEGVRVAGVACPLLVPLVEEGWWSRDVTRAVAREYLAPIRKARVDCLILGCTHYPVITPVFREIMGGAVHLIDSADETAREVETILSAQGLRAMERKPKLRFFASDGPERFLRLANRFLGSKIDQVEVHPFD